MAEQMLEKPLEQIAHHQDPMLGLKLKKRGRYIRSTLVKKGGLLESGIDLADLPFDDALAAKKELASSKLSYRDRDYSAVEQAHEMTSGELLKSLHASHSNITRQCELIIESERIRFPQSTREELASILETFIRTYRDSSEFDVIVAVGSAIRKYIAVMDVRELGSLASLLESGHNGTLSLEMELEVIKMIGRKLAARPPTTDDQEPILASQLARIASDYLRPSTISKDKFSTVAMLSLEALAAMRSSQLKDLLPAVNACSYAGFRRQLQRHLTKIDEQLPQNGESRSWLAGFISAINVT